VSFQLKFSVELLSPTNERYLNTEISLILEQKSSMIGFYSDPSCTSDTSTDVLELEKEVGGHGM
jgi:hypothetical protein